MPKKEEKQPPVNRIISWHLTTKVGYSPKQTLTMELNRDMPHLVAVSINSHDNGEVPRIYLDLQQFADATLEVQEKQWED